MWPVKDGTIVFLLIMADNINTMFPLSLNISRFAEYVETIKMLYQVDDDFKNLCDDYLISKKSLEKFRKKSLENRQQALEYQRLSRELENEMLEYVIKRT